MDMELFLNRVFDGLSNGSTYALIAMALVMIFKATTLINFAQGEMRDVRRVHRAGARHRAGCADVGRSVSSGW